MDAFYSSGDVDVIYSEILRAIWSACGKAVPSVCKVKRKLRPPWETEAVRSARRHRRMAEEDFKRHKSDEARKKRNRAANKLKQTVKGAIIDFEERIAKAADSKHFWRYSRSKLRPHPSVGPLLNPCTIDS